MKQKFNDQEIEFYKIGKVIQPLTGEGNVTVFELDDEDPIAVTHEEIVFSAPEIKEGDVLIVERDEDGKSEMVIHFTEEQFENMTAEFNIAEQEEMYKFFSYQHLPEHLQEISKPLHLVATLMIKNLPEGSERKAGLRKLLEAKDCFVRSMV